jgi:hypothetical protein
MTELTENKLSVKEKTEKTDPNQNRKDEETKL